MNGRRDDADEALSVAAEVAVRRYHQHAPHIRDSRKWLLQLVRNVCIDIHRRRKNELLRGAMAISADGTPELPETRSESPEQRLLRRELRSRVEAAIAALPPLARRTLLLHVEEQLTHRDIATAMATTEENVRKRLQLARDAVRASMRSPSGKRPRNRRGVEAATPRLLLVTVERTDGIEEDALFVLRDDPGSMSERRLRHYLTKHEGGVMRLRLARLLLTQGRAVEALREYMHAIGAGRRNIAAVLESAALLQRLGRRAEAEGMLLQAGVDALPHERSAVEAALLTVRGDHTALAALPATAALDGGSWCAVAVALLEGGRIDDASRACERARAAAPHATAPQALAALCAASAGNARDARALAGDVLTRDVDDVIAMMATAAVTARDADAELLLRLEAIADEHAIVAEVVAGVRMARGECELAVALLRRLILRQPRNVIAWRALADILLRSGQPLRARAAAISAIALQDE